MILHVITTVFKRSACLSRLIYCFVLQTNTNWQLHIIHDGPATDDIKIIIASHHDQRIKFTETPKVNGHWGHPNRQLMLRKLILNHRDYVLITNDDNMYVPVFIEYFLKECKREDVGMVYCDAIHSYKNYDVLKTEIRENHIDMGSFIVRLHIAKKIGFNHLHFSADGTYAVECANYCRMQHLRLIHIAKPLFIHN